MPPRRAGGQPLHPIDQQRRIRVNSISPGAIRTPINTEAWQTPEAYAELMNLIPYKRIGESGEIGQTAVWLDYIVGSTIYIDGG
jgi:glucose 1-dehydrogenase